MGGREAQSVRRGVLLMVASSVAFSLADTGVKWLSAVHPIPQIACALNAMILVAVVASAARERRLGAIWPHDLRPHVLRALLIMGAAACAFYAYQHVPLADAYTLNFTGPVFVTVASAVFLGERISGRQALGVVVAFAGVLIVLRPGAGVMQPAALGALANAALFGLANVLTRRMAATESDVAMLASSAAIGATGFGLTAAGGAWVWPTGTALAAFIATGLVNTIAMLTLVRALRAAPASRIAPVQYTQMLWAVLLGALLFGDRPDAWTLVGCVVIIAGAVVGAGERGAA